MKKVLKKYTIAIFPIAFLSMSSCVMVSGTDNEGDIRRVNGVMWQNQVDIGINEILKEAVADDQTRLVFIRKNDNYSEQTSANISVNNRFQVSLHANNYTAVNSCVGTNLLSAQATGFKNNDLLVNKQDYELVGGQTYFFEVSVDEKGQSTLAQITPASALPLLANKRYQSHQITRVIPNCLPSVTVVPPVISPTVIVEPKQPALTEKVTIDLEVLFETDKAVVRPEYYSKITELSEFMKQYPNTVVSIEGHTDSRASERYNQALSQRRVNAVKEVLITQFGVQADRLSAVGYGESQPRASNDTVEGRQLNRRVVAVVEERARNQ